MPLHRNHSRSPLLLQSCRSIGASSWLLQRRTKASQSHRTAHSNLGTCKCSHMLISCYSCIACNKAIDAAQAPDELTFATHQCACSHLADCLQPQCRPHAATGSPQGSAPAAVEQLLQSSQDPRTTSLQHPQHRSPGQELLQSKSTAAQEQRRTQHKSTAPLSLLELCNCYPTLPAAMEGPENSKGLPNNTTSWSLQLQSHAPCSHLAVCLPPKHGPLFRSTLNLRCTAAHTI